MEQDKLLFYFAVVFLVVAVIIFGINVVKLTKITGKATDTATVNLTISPITNINFTTDSINWGSGSVNVGQTSATLDTSTGTVTGGSWTPVTQGFVLENIGNKNVSLNFSFGTNAAGLLGGTNPSYQYNVTEIESGSCGTPGITLGNWYDASTANTTICGSFYADDTKDSLRIDIKLVVPSDSLTGARSDTLTATAEAI